MANLENLLGTAEGPDFLYRYLLLSELADDDAPEPFAAAALMHTLSGMGTTENAIRRLPAASRLDGNFTDVIYGIAVLEDKLASNNPDVYQVAS